jgi:hypothetical protein
MPITNFWVVVLWLGGGLAGQLLADELRFPDHPNVVNVKSAPYHARGDGVTDDTLALQRALNDHVGRHHLIYFPPGEYLVSASLQWPKHVDGRENWGFTYLSGASAEASTLRLKDGVFTDAARPGAIMGCGGFGSADWFHNYVENLTFDVGANNAGAIGLQFYSNNSGAVRHCRFVAAAGSGLTGLELGQRDMNGPLLVSHCTVSGFRRGMAAAGAVNSQVFENVRLERQEQIGFVNEGQSISIRRLTSHNRVPAISTYGALCLVEAELQGVAGAEACPAIINFNGGQLFLRDVQTRGYQRALADIAHTPDSGAAYRLQGEDKPGSLGPDIAEYSSQPVAMLFPAEPLSLRLPIKETPDTPRSPPAKWAVVDHFGADPSGERDSAAAVQAAVDSGATTLFFPGSYRLDATINLRAKVRQVIGLGGQINYGRAQRPAFRVVKSAGESMAFEHFGYIGGGIEVDTRQTLVVRSVADCQFRGTPRAKNSEWFFEDVVTHDLQLKEQRLWARQLNIENEGIHLTNQGSDLWILGYKTERGGTLIRTSSGGRTEVLGGFSYTTTAGQLAPMFVIQDSQFWCFFREICFNGDPFAILVQETRRRKTLQWKPETGSLGVFSGRTPPTGRP